MIVGERGRRLVDVHPLEPPSALTRCGEEATDVASDLETASGSTGDPRQPPRLGAIRAPLVRVQRLEHRPFHPLGALVDRAQLVRTLLGIAIDEATSAALHDADGGWLGEGGAVEEAVRRGARIDAAGMERPQRLHLRTHLLHPGDLRRLGASADVTARELVGDGLHVHGSRAPVVPERQPGGAAFASPVPDRSRARRSARGR
jgi:hypothetical protein